MSEVLGIANIGLGILNLVLWNYNKSGFNLAAGLFALSVGIILSV